MKKNNYVHTSNSYSFPKLNLYGVGRICGNQLTLNRVNHGPIIHIKKRKQYNNDLILIETPDTEIIRVDSFGNLYIYGNAIQLTEETKQQPLVSSCISGIVARLAFTLSAYG